MNSNLLSQALLLVLLPTVILVAVIMLTKILSDNYTRRHLAQSGVSKDVAGALFTRDRVADSAGSLKWGLVSAGIGLSLMIAEALRWEPFSPLSVGLVFLFAGGGLLLHYRLASRSAAHERHLPQGADDQVQPFPSPRRQVGS